MPEQPTGIHALLAAVAEQLPQNDPATCAATLDRMSQLPAAPPYTDEDVRKAAAEYQAHDMNAFEVLIDMSDRAPWEGLATEDFNEAHDRIVRAAGAI
ncbi:hypothetical protein [Streptomyces sp. NPDC088258]|uniref:hypothetical protein n=1 Tax=Streptomyces sp. NPDC088258 TaxID=3365849 RepID=UPI0037FDBCDE